MDYSPTARLICELKVLTGMRRVPLTGPGTRTCPAVFMVAAMWVFPEAGVKKGDIQRAK